MRQGVVYLNKERVGIITELSSNEYKFRYDDEYFNDNAYLARYEQRQ